jgi:hypothetical protein
MDPYQAVPIRDTKQEMTLILGSAIYFLSQVGLVQ